MLLNLPCSLSSNLLHPANDQSDRPNEKANSWEDDWAFPMEWAGQKSTLYRVSHETTHRENGKWKAHSKALNLIRLLFLQNGWHSPNFINAMR